MHLNLGVRVAPPTLPVVELSEQHRLPEGACLVATPILGGLPPRVPARIRSLRNEADRQPINPRRAWRRRSARTAPSKAGTNARVPGGIRCHQRLPAALAPNSLEKQTLRPDLDPDRVSGHYRGNFVVTGALLQGVFSPKEPRRLLDEGVEIFWSHRLEDLEEWLRETRDNASR